MPDVMKTVGRYEILREVGRGGMAMVFLARQTDLDRFVALKELGAFHASDPSFAQRFLRESRVAGSLSHPNIVTVHDYFEHEGTPYIAMEYVERGSLRPYVGRLSLAQIGGVLEGLLAGLAAAEAHGVVHRDLKPENLMVTADGRVKIADFGIAKATTKMQTGAFLTATGTTVGTPTYMAPEQAMAQDIGPWTDLYSVGCMAFELFTGRVPFHDSDAPMAILLRHVNEPIPPVTSVEPSVDQGIADWIERLLVKDPASRTQSANEAWDEFEEIVIGLLGPRWRREARLLERAPDVDTPKPLTPAPFEGTTADGAVSDEFQSFAWGSAATPETGAAPAAPGPYTPPPHDLPPGPMTAPPEEPVTPPPVEAAATAAPGEQIDSGFVTFGAPAPAPPTDALVPAAAEAEAVASPAEAPAPDVVTPPPAELAPAEQESGGFETYIAPPPLLPPTEEPPLEPPTAAPLAPDEPHLEPPTAVPPAPVAAAPEPEPEPELEPAATVMPRRVERAAEPAAPAARSKALPIAIGVGVLLIAVIAIVVLGSGGGSKKTASTSPAGGSPSVPVANADLGVKMPASWARQASVPALPGLTFTDPVAIGPKGGDGSVVFGQVKNAANNSTLLSGGLIEAIGNVPAKQTVELGPNRIQALRYRGIALGGRKLTLYAAPTTGGVATLACVSKAATFGRDCDAVANTLTLSGGAKGFPVGPSKAYAAAVARSLGAAGKAEKSGRSALSSAKTPKAMARATAATSKAYAAAAKTLTSDTLSPADGLANSALVAALKRTAAAYGKASSAAAKNDRAGFKNAGGAVKAGQTAVGKAIDGLKAAGYTLPAAVLSTAAAKPRALPTLPRPTVKHKKRKPKSSGGGGGGSAGGSTGSTTSPGGSTGAGTGGGSSGGGSTGGGSTGGGSTGGGSTGGGSTGGGSTGGGSTGGGSTGGGSTSGGSTGGGSTSGGSTGGGSTSGGGTVTGGGES